MASAVIGFVSTFLLMQPFVDGAKKLKEHPEKYGLDKNGKMFERLNFEINGVKKDPTRIEVYSDFIKYFPKVVFAPLIATSTIALIPVMDKYVLNKIVFKKNPAAQNAEMTPMDVYRSTSFKSNSNRHEKAFQSFAGGNV